MIRVIEVIPSRHAIIPASNLLIFPSERATTVPGGCSYTCSGLGWERRRGPINCRNLYGESVVHEGAKSVGSPTSQGRVWLLHESGWVQSIGVVAGERCGRRRHRPFLGWARGASQLQYSTVHTSLWMRERLLQNTACTVTCRADEKKGTWAHGRDRRDSPWINNGTLKESSK